ncbi:MAG TPA: Hsp20/alpha crystallin family protein [Bacteroidota bacterium]|nr:Hsp20/alpha crystallin family protein [Bacteroidota bacterium]
MLNSVFENLLGLERDLDSLFEGAVLPSRFISPVSAPAMNLVDEGREFIATLELPGVKKEAVKITKNGNALTISGERMRGSAPENGKWLRNESWEGNFSRTLELPKGIDESGIAAELTNGVLRVVLPKAEAIKPREIAIR